MNELEDYGGPFVYNVFTIGMSWMVLILWLWVLSNSTELIFAVLVTLGARQLEKAVSGVNPYLA